MPNMLNASRYNAPAGRDTLLALLRRFNHRLTCKPSASVAHIVFDENAALESNYFTEICRKHLHASKITILDQENLMNSHSIKEKNNFSKF